MTIQLELKGTEIVMLEKILRMFSYMLEQQESKAIEVTNEVDPSIQKVLTKSIYEKVSYQLKHGDRS